MKIFIVISSYNEHTNDVQIEGVFNDMIEASKHLIDISNIYKSEDWVNYVDKENSENPLWITLKDSNSKWFEKSFEVWVEEHFIK